MVIFSRPGSPGIEFERGPAFLMNDEKPLVLDAQRWIEAFWNEKNPEEEMDSIHPRCEFLGWGRSVMGKERWIENRNQFRKSFDPLLVSVVEIVSTGKEASGHASGHARFAGRHRTSGLEVDVFFSFFLRWEKGKIVWMRSLLDMTSLYAQLNLMDLRKWESLFE